jgi:hypothetical protein
VDNLLVGARCCLRLRITWLAAALYVVRVPRVLRGLVTHP